ncbi:MAG TPA: DUF4402 domain-containing protein [Sphingomicrobium sp.]
MSGAVSARLSAALALCAMSEAAAAVTPQQQATAGATIIHPLTVTKIQDMDFGELSVGVAGTAVLEPNANSLTTTGGVASIGGSPTCAEFVGAAQSNSVVNIKIPNGSVTLTRVGGTETMTVSNFTLQGQSKRALARAQSFTFRVGGTLNVAAGQVEGLYVGTFDVTVQYP